MSEPAAVALHVSRRLFGLEGETRLNLLRLVGIAVFYAVHLVNRYLVGMSTGASIDFMGMNLPVFDTAATALALAWAWMAGAVLIAVRSPLPQRAISVGTTLADAAFLMTLILLGNGPSSPMILALLLLVVASGLRGDREIVWLATVGSLAAYGASVGFGLYVRPDLMVPRHHILVVSSSLVLAGVVTDFTLASFWRAVQGHGAILDRVREAGGPAMTVPERTDLCPWCGASTHATARSCSRCEQPLVAGVPFRTTRAASVLQAGPVHVGWAVSVVMLLVVSVSIGIALAIDWPALLVPYIGASALLLVALGRMLQLDLRVDENDRAVNRTLSTLGTAAATFALGATALALLLAMVALTVVAAMVIAFALCLVVVTGGGGFHP
ncbi:MAG: hypothetical protein H6737_24380 [Alphaproteobacteria bacterium]|nr:hypothetical protein [Alphaproteobacteria bacterium]